MEAIVWQEVVLKILFLLKSTTGPLLMLRLLQKVVWQGVVLNIIYFLWIYIKSIVGPYIKAILQKFILTEQAYSYVQPFTFQNSFFNYHLSVRCSIPYIYKFGLIYISGTLLMYY